MRNNTARAAGAAVASVTRAMRVLEAFADHSDDVALTQLSAKLGYGKASLSKIMTTMEREGFVRRDEAGVAPTHATASGKVWLASLPESRALEVMRSQGSRG